MMKSNNFSKSNHEHLSSSSTFFLVSLARSPNDASYARRRWPAMPTTSPLKCPSAGGRLRRLLASLRPPARAGPLPVQTGSATTKHIGMPRSTLILPAEFVLARPPD